MKFGAVYPQSEAGTDPAAIRTYIQGVEKLGYSHLLAYDHVVGADPEVHAPWSGPYDIDTTFHEPFVLFGHLAGMTSLELVNGVLVLPQRQTVLVAKQASLVDMLTNGNFRLGVSVGWNPVEYTALGKDFSDRGRRIDEQIDLLRRLWTEDVVNFDGDYEQVVAAGIRPLPVQRPIPIWVGANSAPGYRRAGRLGDGWFPVVQPGPELDAARKVVNQSALDAGRDPDLIDMEGHLWWSGDLDTALSQIEAWDAAGASHLAITTMDSDLSFPHGHLEVLSQIASASGLGASGT